MKLYLKFDTNHACRVILQEKMQEFGIDYELKELGEVEIKGNLPADVQKNLEAALEHYGIRMVNNHKNTLIEKTKDIIVEMIYEKEKLPSTNISTYLADRLNHSYGYISNLFSEVTYSSIENFIIIQKIERAKQLIIDGEFTLTEISYQLNYSSVAHLSNQFKKTTGLTPTSFQRIIKKRADTK
ncbi:helix-turn-helix domain-containing protein [Flavobacterium silvaticum]|uniref:Helix-turn-helix transcriptional regulator n=1 Tax=Flavobacterium silvaticum TaxID=1852020 RepID=A0A972FJS2_9FLAO|nr:AraC family transcriptional regulator [Flavobacterium silvaticum]NMH27339.1 helix-turn-helix transcriptional regulator [Flavobacterium silvaticum]